MDRTSRPIYAIAYLVVFIVFYEIGTFLISPETLDASFSQQQIRVVSFIWLQNALQYLGFSNRVVWVGTPLAVVLILFALQITSRTSWKVRLGDFAPMTMECVLLAIPLIVLSLSLNRYAHSQAQAYGTCANGQVGSCAVSAAGETAEGVTDTQSASSRRTGPNRSSMVVNIVTGIGAGIYEELVFRLILICVLMIIFQDLLGVDKGVSIAASILISAVFFSLHHYRFFLNGSLHTGDAFSMTTFFFRLLAGVYFAVVFAVRGFGITAGTHAFYDIIAAIMNAVFFAGSD
jgi:membrane protease YdiL (CAAX protease family)